ncbi:hypothetical protein NOV72_01636 [Caballeronia novacaledonica]|uniref:Uncharacterized protein n=1 Tax=Caballeronia novacaledonica TaxID=1544861 RepID=A0A2U3I2N3_9BURK|nr:hypothetical protein [Caballeronia novacaledonica]SPB14394.1 hypothetical protein NOV72_01636 [Caballeronia novacaledonica]
MRASPQRVSEEAAGLATGPVRLFKAFVATICIGSLIEIPLDTGASIDSNRLLFVLAPKLVMIFIGVAAIADVPFARQAFTFICAVSVLAIAPALPIEYGRYISIALLVSTVECIGKSVCIATFAIMSWRETQSYSQQDFLC